MGLGVALAAVEVVPLGFYLARSPVWTDRSADRPSALTIERPRLLDAACTAFPYAFGSQRRGHPNLARGLGVHNLNESAGGFAGLATLVWLAPAGWLARREIPRARFLAALGAVGMMGAFAIPPVPNLLRLVPVLNVIDHRRLTLWVAFSLILLGAIGLDRLRAMPRAWVCSWLAVAVAWLAVAAAVGPIAGPVLRGRILAHYDAAARRTPGADRAVFRARAERQLRLTRDFVPRYAVASAASLLALAGLAVAWRRGAIGPDAVRAGLSGLVLADLVGFGYGLNPAIERADDRPVGALIAYLKCELPPSARVLALGSVLPPNMLMRYGLADVRNYDSVESARNLAWFAPLYEPGGSRTSRREVTWDGVRRALDRLEIAGVGAVVGPSAPPPGLFDRVDRVGASWVGRLNLTAPDAIRRDHNSIDINFRNPHIGSLNIFESFDPGWRAWADGEPAPVSAWDGAFLSVAVPPGARRVALRYDPPEVRYALMLSSASGMVVLLGLSRGEWTRKSGFGAWMAGRRRVRIGSMIADRSSSPASH